MHVARVLSAITGLMIGGVLAGGILGSITAAVVIGESDGYEALGATPFVIAGMVGGLAVGLVVAVVWLVREANRQDRERRQHWNDRRPARSRPKTR